MFENLNETLENDNNEFSNQIIIDDICKISLMESESLAHVPSGLLAFEAINKELSDLEDIANVIEKHGNSKSLISYVNRNRGLENLFNDTADNIAEMSPEDIRSRIDEIIDSYESIEVYDRIINNDEDQISQEFLGTIIAIGINLAILGGIIYGGIKLFLHLQDKHEAKKKAVESTVKKLDDGIDDKKWDDERAGTLETNMYRSSDINFLLKNISIDIKKIANAIFDKDLPKDKNSYLSWTKNVENSLSNFKKVYDIKIDWDKKNPSFKMSQPKTTKTEGTLKSLGYSANSYNELNNLIKSTIKSLDQELKNNKSKLEARMKTIEQKKKDENDKLPKDKKAEAELYARSAMKGGFNIYFSIAKHMTYQIIPLATYVLGIIAKNYK